MIHFIVSGHGHFASGAVSAATLIAGEAEAFTAIDFPEGDNASALAERLQTAINALGDAPVIIFTDILGGMPFRSAAQIAAERARTEVVCGTNVQLLVEAALERSEDSDPLDLLNQILPNAREGLNRLSAIQPKTPVTPDADDGI